MFVRDDSQESFSSLRAIREKALMVRFCGCIERSQCVLRNIAVHDAHRQGVLKEKSGGRENGALISSAQKNTPHGAG
jgi:hypothetical protein